MNCSVSFFFTSPCKGEVGAPKVGFIRLWNLVRRVGVLVRFGEATPSLTLPLTGGGKMANPVIKSHLLYGGRL